MSNKMNQWCKQEWKDYKKILKLNRDGLLFQIWKERSNKLNWGLIGLLIGLIIGSL